MPLTRREREVLALIVDGMTNQQIADQLFISPRTVDTHRTNIMQKLDIHDLANLVRYAIEHGTSGSGGRNAAQEAVMRYGGMWVESSTSLQ